MNNTVKALLARGLDNQTAERLYKDGYPLKRLKQMNESELKRLGLDAAFIQKIRDESRPPIDTQIINQLLWESRYICNVCTQRGKSIIIHHIIPWEESHSHKKENLVVLCIECHDKAHTKHELSLNITAERIKHAKQSWLQKVDDDRKEIIQGIVKTPNAEWDYFNILRLGPLLERESISHKGTKYYNYLLENGYIDENEIIMEDKFSKARHYWLNFGLSQNIYYHYKELVGELLSKRPVKILNEIWSREQILSNLSNGDIFLLQGAFYFKRNTRKEDEIFVYRKASGIRVHTIINKWYRNSASAEGRLSGRNVSTLVGIVQNVEKDKEEITIKCTALSIGSFMERITGGRWDIEAKDILEEQPDADKWDHELIEKLDIDDIEKYLPFEGEQL